MKVRFKTVSLIALVCTTFVAIPAASQVRPAKRWAPAVYHGLTVGKSTQRDVIRILGQPTLRGIAPDTDNVPVFAYEVVDPVKGRLEVYFSRWVVSSMALFPDTPLSKADVIRIFGSNYLEVRYDTDPCGKDTNTGTSEIYEDASGEVKHLEYRDKGIAVHFQLTEGTEILYVHEPFGPPHSRCGVKKGAG